MSALWFWGLALVGVVALWLLWSARHWRRPLSGETALDWLRQRQQELVGEDEALLMDAEHRVIDDGEERVLEAVAVEQSPLLMIAVVLFVAIFSVFLYREIGAQGDVDIAEQLARLDDATPQDVQILLDAIIERAAQRPDNLDYQSILGEYYLSSDQPELALAAYRQMLRIAPDAPELLGRAAQASFLAAGRQLDAEAASWAQQALALQPMNRAALGTLGMAAFERQDFAEAVSYWGRMLALETPGTPGYDMLSSVIANARELGGLASEVAPQEPLIGVNVVVDIDPTLTLEDSPTVFVLARPAGVSQRMPTAVVRIDAPQFPLSVTLDDAVSMAGQRLSDLEQADLEVQLTYTGRAGLADAAGVARLSGATVGTNEVFTLLIEPISSPEGN